MKLKDAIKAGDLAEKLGVIKETVLGWRELGMPWVQIGKEIYVIEASFMKWIKSREITNNAQDALEQDLFGRPISEHRVREN